MSNLRTSLASFFSKSNQGQQGHPDEPFRFRCPARHFCDAGKEHIKLSSLLTEYCHVENALTEAYHTQREQHEQLIRNLSHEYRTRLHNILGHVQTNDTDRHVKATEDERVIQQECEALLNLSDTIVRLFADTLTSAETEEQFSLSDLCNSVIDNQITPLNNSGSTISISFAEDMPHLLKGRAREFSEILSQLLRVIERGMPHGQLEIHVASRVVTGNQARVDFWFNGIHHGKDRHQEELNADAKAFIDLHLAIAERMIDHLGGTFKIDCKGETFSIHFDVPFAIAQRYAEAACLLPQHENGADDELGVEALAGMHVLIVDDNTINQRIAARMMSGCGAIPAVADNGEAALNFARSFRFDLVLMDCQMPGMDGWEATSKLREIDGYRDTPIIGITACALPGDRERCIASGMNNYLAKPFNELELAKVILAMRENSDN